MGLYGPSALAALFVGRLWEKLTGTEYREDPVFGRQPVNPAPAAPAQSDFRRTLADVADQASMPAHSEIHPSTAIETVAVHEDEDMPPSMPF